MEALIQDNQICDADGREESGRFTIVGALTACYIPAYRAMRVDPMVALRYE